MPTKQQPVRFADKKGFWPAFLLGTICDFFILYVTSAVLVAGMFILLFLVVLAYLGYDSIRKDRNNGNYSLFVGSVMAMWGLLLGSILLWVTAGREKVFKHFMAILLVMLIINGIYGVLLGFSSTK